MITVRDVSKYYGEFCAVDRMTFTIEKGQITGLLGPNGAGKTTTMRMITGYFAPTSGSIIVDGVNIEKDPLSVKRKIGYLPETAPLYGEMMVFDYLSWVAETQGVYDPAKLRESAATCGLTDVMHKNITELSRGYRQRVGLAHAMIHDPEILILDEPTSGLDPNQIIEVRNLIKEIGRTKTIVISTHILPEVEQLCERVIIVADGRKVADSPTARLRSAYGGRSEILIKAKADRDAGDGAAARELETMLRNVRGVLDVVPSEEQEEGLVCLTARIADGAEVRPAVVEKVTASGWSLYELSRRTSTLEDVFRELTTGDGAEPGGIVESTGDTPAEKPVGSEATGGQA